MSETIANIPTYDIDSQMTLEREEGDAHTKWNGRPDLSCHSQHSNATPTIHRALS